MQTNGWSPLHFMLKQAACRCVASASRLCWNLAAASPWLTMFYAGGDHVDLRAGITLLSASHGFKMQTPVCHKP